MAKKLCNDQLESEAALDALEAEKQLTAVLRKMGYRRKKHEIARFRRGRRLITVEIDGWLDPEVI